MKNDGKFKRIRNGEFRLSAQRFNQEHLKCRSFIQKAVAESKASKIVVATHQIPSFELMAPEFKNSSINGAFTVELGNLIADSPIDYWIYGHSHRNIDKTIGSTQCVSNQTNWNMYSRMNINHSDRMQSSKSDHFF